MYQCGRIPVICGSVGAVLGVVGLKVMPDFPAADIVTAVAVGIVSGFAATGVNLPSTYVCVDAENPPKHGLFGLSAM